METLAPVVGWHCAEIAIRTTRATDFIDITDRLTSLAARLGARTGFINVQALHTTTAIVVNEHEPLLLADFESTLDFVAPTRRGYRHDAPGRTINLTLDERINGHAHCRAFVLATSACLNIVDGRLVLGAWQRVFLVELDGPRDRRLSVVVMGDLQNAAGA